jgi:hypothetical protein
MRELFKQNLYAILGTVLSIGVGVGAQMILPSTPHNGISIIILTIALVAIIWALSLRHKRLKKKGGSKIMFYLGIACIIVGCVFVITQLDFRATATTEQKLQVEKVVGLLNYGWGLQVDNNSTTEVARDCVGMLDIVEGVTPPPVGSEAAPPFSVNDYFSNHALHWANPNIIYQTSSSILEVIHALYPFQSSQQGMYTWAWENQPSTPVVFAYSLLILIEIDASNYSPSYTLCFFRHRGMNAFGSLEIVNNNLDTKPTIEQCKQMLTQYIAEYPN